LIPTFSPQGDGNDLLTQGFSRLLGTLIPTFSPQGDGNGRLQMIQGPNNLIVDPYLFPARGRKRPLFMASTCHASSWLIPTFSPQGDGNFPG